jgi:hypothetical protein
LERRWGDIAISDPEDQAEDSGESADPAEAPVEALPTTRTGGSALNWHNPIYDDEKWEPSPPSNTDLFGMAVATIFGVLVTLYMRVQRRGDKRPSAEIRNPLNMDHFWRWPLSTKLLTVFGFIAVVGVMEALAGGYRWAFSITGAHSDGFALTMIVLGLALFGLPILIVAYRRVLRRRSPDPPPWPQSLDQAPPAAAEPALAPPLPDIVTAPKPRLTRQLLGLIVVVLLAVALVVLIRYGPR